MNEVENVKKKQARSIFFIVHCSLLCFASISSRLGIAQASLTLPSLLRKVIRSLNKAGKQ